MQKIAQMFLQVKNLRPRHIKLILDYLFIGLVAFLFFCVWCNFYFRSFRLTFLPAFIMTIVFMCFFHVFMHMRKEKKAALIALKNAAKQTYVELIHMENIIAKALITKAFQASQSQSLKNPKSVHLYFRFTQGEATEQDIVSSIREAKTQGKNRINIFCESAPQKLKALAASYENFNVEFFEYIETHNLLAGTNLLPPKTINFKTHKITFKQFFALLIAPGKSRSYFLIGLFLSFTTLFTPFKIYYAIFATFFFILSLLSKFYQPRWAEKYTNL